MRTIPWLPKSEYELNVYLPFTQSMFDTVLSQFKPLIISKYLPQEWLIAWIMDYTFLVYKSDMYHRYNWSDDWDAWHNQVWDLPFELSTALNLPNEPNLTEDVFIEPMINEFITYLDLIAQYLGQFWDPGFSQAINEVTAQNQFLNEPMDLWVMDTTLTIGGVECLIGVVNYDYEYDTPT